MTVTATLSGTVSGGVSALGASANSSLGLSMSAGLTAQVTYGASFLVPQTARVGYLYAGADADRVNVTKGQYISCTWVTQAGTLQAPYSLPSFWHTVA